MATSLTDAWAIFERTYIPEDAPEELRRDMKRIWTHGLYEAVRMLKAHDSATLEQAVEILGDQYEAYVKRETFANIRRIDGGS